jgi:hypothetical protein
MAWRRDDVVYCSEAMPMPETYDSYGALRTDMHTRVPRVLYTKPQWRGEAILTERLAETSAGGGEMRVMDHGDRVQTGLFLRVEAGMFPQCQIGGLVAGQGRAVTASVWCRNARVWWRRVWHCAR